MFRNLRYTTFLLVVIFSFGFISGDSDVYYEMSRGIDIFGRVYKEVNLNYVDTIDPQEFMREGIKGMLSSLDPYTTFIDENMQKDISIITDGKYGGIGATIGVRNEKVTVVDLIEGYSAQRQGIRIGDVIIRIDDVEMNREKYDELSSLMKGEPGTLVSVGVMREGTEKEITFNLVREEVEIKNLSYYGFVPEESNNAYLKLSGFSRPAGDEIRKALSELSGIKNINSIILDLRGNPGGLLDAAIDVSEKFVKNKQLVVSVVSRDTTRIKKYYSEEEPVSGDASLIVLIDEGSASASEIVAGAVQDHDRGVILGAPSFGKGLVQTLIPLSFNTSLKVTTARYFTPSGRCIQKVDYSNNDVIAGTSSIKSESFFTDNGREVFAKGGISPDSLVIKDSESELVISLLAEGVFFKFATKYFNSDENIDYKTINQNKLFNDFMEYLKNEERVNICESENLLNQLKKEAAEKELGDKFQKGVQELYTLLEEQKFRELEEYRDDVVIEIKKELSARQEGRKGRIKLSLTHDPQFSAAYEIINKPDIYRELLTRQN